MKKLIHSERFENTILKYYSDGSCYQKFSNGVTWRLF